MAGSRGQLILLVLVVATATAWAGRCEDMQAVVISLLNSTVYPNCVSVVEASKRGIIPEQFAPNVRLRALPAGIFKVRSRASTKHAHMVGVGGGSCACLLLRHPYTLLDMKPNAGAQGTVGTHDQHHMLQTHMLHQVAPGLCCELSLALVTPRVPGLRACGCFELHSPLSPAGVQAGSRVYLG
jgi:hypothetical protein